MDRLERKQKEKNLGLSGKLGARMGGNIRAIELEQEQKKIGDLKKDLHDLGSKLD